MSPLKAPETSIRDPIASTASNLVIEPNRVGELMSYEMSELPQFRGFDEDDRGQRISTKARRPGTRRRAA
jgi:hypothetical protein